MKTLDTLTLAFGKDFEHQIAKFAVEQKLLPAIEDIQSNRFLTRSVLPHIKKLSSLFNREEKDQGSALEPYWKESSNPKNLRLAYFIYFMPSNLFRVASIWAELSRLGYRWKSERFRAIEFGAGPASGACGIAAGEHYASVGLPKVGDWALIEQDQVSLQMGASWLRTYLEFLNHDEKDWTIRPFHRKVVPGEGFLPKGAPKFNLWLMSFYLNELEFKPDELAAQLTRAWETHLEDEGLIIFVEPALKLQSRRLLELRREILKIQAAKKVKDLQILTPCLGHQTCGALENPEDWCHEDVTWWRPPYFRKIDQLAGLDRKSLPFSYLVIAKSKRSRVELLPRLAGTRDDQRERLVSPAHSEGRDFEFFICGQSGKRRARYRPTGENDPAANVGRGDILLEPEIRGDKHSSKVTSLKDCV